MDISLLLLCYIKGLMQQYLILSVMLLQYCSLSCCGDVGTLRISQPNARQKFFVVVIEFIHPCMCVGQTK